MGARTLAAASSEPARSGTVSRIRTPVLTATDLVCWTKLICFADDKALARCEIAAFRYRVLHVAAQLDIPATTDLTPYQLGDTRWDHATEIKQRFGYRDFTDQPEHFRLVQWLYTRAWLSAERPSVLFDLATARLVERKILLPGV